MHLLPIEQLRVDGHYWIERQDIRRLQTGRDLVRTPSAKSQASKEFMIAFYTHWLQQKVSDPAAALRQTKLDYIRAGRDPQVWAPYVLISGR